MLTATPHDALFKAGFEIPEAAAGLMRHVLPPAIIEAIAWDSLARESGSFIGPEFAARHSDLVFQATLNGKPALIYLLLEHQSTNDADMPLRMLVYLTRIWERFRKEKGNQGKPLPPIIPIVIAHAPEGWTAPRTFHALFQPELIGVPALAEVVPRFSLFIEDLSTFSNDDIEKSALEAFQKLVVWALRDGRNSPRMVVDVVYWTRAFEEAVHGPRGREALEHLMRYLYSVVDELYRAELHARLVEIPDVGDVAMTIAEQMRNEGRAEGRAEGREQGKRELLRELLVLKFGDIPDELAARIDAAGLDDLARYAARVLTAKTIDAVFA